MNPRAWLLLVLDAAGRRGLTPAQLQKSLFLLGQELPGALGTDEFYQFTPYNYGPFSKQVYDDAEALAADGLALIFHESGMRYAKYSITPLGQSEATSLRNRADRRAVEYLRAVVLWAQSRSFSELIRSIYAKYPQYRVNSVFQG